MSLKVNCQICDLLLLIHLFYMALKVNHTVAGPKRDWPSHNAPVQTFVITLKAIRP